MRIVLLALIILASETVRSQGLHPYLSASVDVMGFTGGKIDRDPRLRVPNQPAVWGLGAMQLVTSRNNSHLLTGIRYRNYKYTVYNKIELSQQEFAYVELKSPMHWWSVPLRILWDINLKHKMPMSVSVGASLNYWHSSQKPYFTSASLKGRSAENSIEEYKSFSSWFPTLDAGLYLDPLTRWPRWSMSLQLSYQPVDVRMIHCSGELLGQPTWDYTRRKFVTIGLEIYNQIGKNKTTTHRTRDDSTTISL